MPIAISRDDEQRRLTVTVTDPWSVEEIAVAMDRQISERAWKYGTLYDLRTTASVPAEPDVQWLVKRAQQQATLHGTRGPIAVLIGGAADRGLLQQYVEYGGEHSYVVIRVFDDGTAAHTWLAEHTT